MGYRSVLSAVFRLKLPELSISPVLQVLLHSFKVEAPSCSILPSSWDLDKVLVYLRSSAFEPLQYPYGPCPRSPLSFVFGYGQACQ